MGGLTPAPAQPFDVMPDYLSPEWVRQFDDALRALDLTDAVTQAGGASLSAADGAFAVAQVVTDAPTGEVRTVLAVANGTASMVLDPEAVIETNVTMVLAYEDARAIACGALDPADALAQGRVRVKGELAVLVAAQHVLKAAASELGTTLADLTD